MEDAFEHVKTFLFLKIFDIIKGCKFPYNFWLTQKNFFPSEKNFPSRTEKNC